MKTVKLKLRFMKSRSTRCKTAQTMALALDIKYESLADAEKLEVQVINREMVSFHEQPPPIMRWIILYSPQSHDFSPSYFCVARYHPRFRCFQVRPFNDCYRPEYVIEGATHWAPLPDIPVHKTKPKKRQRRR